MPFSYIFPGKTTERPSPVNFWRVVGGVPELAVNCVGVFISLPSLRHTSDAEVQDARRGACRNF